MGCFIALVKGIKRGVFPTDLVKNNKDNIESVYQIIGLGEEIHKGNQKPLLVEYPYGDITDDIRVRCSDDLHSFIIYHCKQGNTYSLVVSFKNITSKVRVIPLITSIRRDNDCLRNLFLSILFDNHDELNNRRKRIVTKLLLEHHRKRGPASEFFHAKLGKVKVFLDYQVNEVVLFTRNFKRVVDFEKAHCLKI